MKWELHWTDYDHGYRCRLMGQNGLPAGRDLHAWTAGWLDAGEYRP